MKQFICWMGLALGAGCITGFIFGHLTAEEVTKVKYYNLDYKELCKTRSKQLEYMQNMLHTYYFHDDNFFWDVIAEGDDYLHYDKLVEGDWEDFFLPWTEYEQSKYNGEE